MVLAEFVEEACVPTVESCFREEQLFNRLLSFGRTCNAEQRLLLLRGVLRYEQLHDAAERESAGRELVKTLFGKNGVELSSGASKTIAVAAESGTFGPATFELAKGDLQRFFVFDLYPRFLAEDSPLSSPRAKSSSAGVAQTQQRLAGGGLAGSGKASVSSPEVRRAASRREGSGSGSSSPPEKKGASDNLPSPGLLRRSSKKNQSDSLGSGGASPEAPPKRLPRLGSRATSPEKKKGSGSTSPVHSPPLSPKRTLLSMFRRKPRAAPLPAPVPLVTPQEITRSQRRDSYTRSLEEFIESHGSNSRGMVQKTLLAIVNTEGKCDLFRKFLELRYMDEGLTCLLSILEFELVPTAENGRIIYERYIAPDSPEEITLEAHVALTVKVAVEAGQVPPFGDVKREILASLSMVLAEFLDTYKMPTVEESLADHRMLPFAQSCHAEATVLFLRAAAAYERLPSEAEREAAGRDMLKQFLTVGAPLEINTSNRQRSRVEEEVATRTWPANLFKALKDEQSKLFVFDLYPRFLNSCGF